MAFQRIAEKDFSVIETCFNTWYENASLFEKRGFAATLAHPPILQNKDMAAFSLMLSDKMLSDILSLDKNVRSSEAFKVLSKGLQYTISVFAADLPEEGFELLKKYAVYKDSEIRKIIKENLGKARLAKKYYQNVQDVLQLM